LNALGDKRRGSSVTTEARQSRSSIAYGPV
jgi:hypothetical protein